jgi:ubiquinone/menaquinone biosynthesis C-methylase UbiE
MALSDKYAVEQGKWDSIARRKQAPEELVVPKGTNFGTSAERPHTLFGPIAEFLGPLAGKRVIEYGCGTGQLSVLLARSGAQVEAFDISPESIAVSRRRAELNGVQDAITFRVAAAERLPYEDAVFDIAVGKAVLHHLEADLAQPELLRVLKPAGRGAFAEPLGTNPLITFSRAYIPYPGKHPRGADRPLTYKDIHDWSADFSEFSHQETQLFSMLERVLGSNTQLSTLRRMDAFLLSRFPSLRPLCRYVRLLMVK